MPRKSGAPWTARVLTIFPEAFPGPLGISLTGKALSDGTLGLGDGGHPWLRQR